MQIVSDLSILLAGIHQPKAYIMDQVYSREVPQHIIGVDISLSERMHAGLPPRLGIDRRNPSSTFEGHDRKLMIFQSTLTVAHAAHKFDTFGRM